MNDKAPDGFWYAQREFTLRHRLGTSGAVHSLARRFQHFQRMFIHRFPGIAQPQLAGGSVQQFAAHLLFQPRDAATDGGWRNPALTGDGGKAALFDNLYEEGEVGEKVQIHLCSQSKSALVVEAIIAVNIINILC
jgi:hypothetical protein